jgi:hypothetical protein
MRLSLTLAVFLLDLWALASLFGARAPLRSKVLWTLAILALPMAGAAAWWLAGPRRH